MVNMNYSTIFKYNLKKNLPTVNLKHVIHIFILFVGAEPELCPYTCSVRALLNGRGTRSNLVQQVKSSLRRTSNFMTQMYNQYDSLTTALAAGRSDQ